MKNQRTGVARAIAKAGHCSRSQAAAMVRAGRVRINGRVTRDEESPTRAGDRITIDGEPLAAATRTYLMMNKPRGLVVTAKDERGRETVYSRLPAGTPFVAPVGRLDQASEGLLLLTNDSAWAAAITAPESHIPKTYHVQIDCVPDAGLISKLRAGVVDGGERLTASAVQMLRAGEKHGWLEMVLEEGKNRQIRRMLLALKVETLRLVRVAIGELALGGLKKGEVRRLTAGEAKALAELAKGQAKAKRRPLGGRHSERYRERVD